MNADFDLDELSRLHEAATPGEWTFHWWHGIFGEKSEFAPLRGSVERQDDAALIVAMRNALPKLIERVKGSATVAAEWENQYNAAMHHIDKLSAENARLTAELAEAKAGADKWELEARGWAEESNSLRKEVNDRHIVQAKCTDENRTLRRQVEKTSGRLALAEAEVKRLTDGITALADKCDGGGSWVAPGMASRLRALLAKDGA